jgi:plasmid stabilization system protein ParE
MAFEIRFSPRAVIEIEEALNFYLLRSESAASNFTLNLNRTISLLERYPFFLVVYKNIRAIKIKNYPYRLFYTFDENNREIEILACFHTSQNPKKLP